MVVIVALVCFLGGGYLGYKYGATLLAKLKTKL